MKRIIALLALAQFFEVSAQLVLPCDNDSLGLIPLTEMDTLEYEGLSGGLYGDGNNNIPTLHYKRGRAIIKNLKPIDSTGNIDYINGRIVIAGMGPSVAGQAFNAWRDSMSEYYLEEKNECLYFTTTSVGGKSLQDMVDTTTNIYWNSFRNQCITKGIDYNEIQVAWILQISELDTPDFNVYIDSSVQMYAQAIQLMKDSLPNLKILFLSGMHYGGYAHPSHERYKYLKEPNSYWSNFVVQQLIKNQISGDPQYSYTGSTPNMPYFAWGPYFWADGNNPREMDGLVWECDDFRTDEKGGGFHLKESSLYKEALQFKTFFREGELASLLFLDSPLWSACDSLAWDTMRLAQENMTVELSVYPNPSGSSEVYIQLEKSGIINIQITDLSGRIIQEEILFSDNNTYKLEFKNITSGLYILTIHVNDKIKSTMLTISQ